MPQPSLPPLAERAVLEMESVTGRVLAAVVALQESARWKELQRTLGSLSRLAGADSGASDEPAPVLDPALGVEALGYLARRFLFDPAMLEPEGKGGPVFRLRVPEVAQQAADDDGLLAKLVNGLDIATTVREQPDGVLEVVCSTGGVDKPLVTIALGHGRLDLVMDLAAARGAWAHLATVLQRLAADEGELELEGLELRKLMGVVSVGVSAPDAGRIVVTVDLRKDLRLEAAVEAGAVHARIGASRPLLQLENDSTRGVGTLTLNLGAVEVRVPTAEEDEPAAALELKVAALTAQLEVGAGGDITLSNVSLGSEAAVLTRDGEKIAFAELNGKSGRRATLALRQQDTGMDVETQTPVAVGLGWDGDTWALKSAKGTRLRLANDEEEDDQVLQVMEGEVSVSVAGSKPVKAGGGKVLVLLDEDDARPDEKHPLLRLLAVRDAPPT